MLINREDVMSAKDEEADPQGRLSAVLTLMLFPPRSAPFILLIFNESGRKEYVASESKRYDRIRLCSSGDIVELRDSNPVFQMDKTGLSRVNPFWAPT